MLERAVEACVHAFAMGKSRTYPYEVSRFEHLWVMQDHPPRKDARKSEVMAVEQDPASVVDRVQRSGVGWHFLCDISGPDFNHKDRKAAYKRLGYRAMSTEWVFVHDLDEIPVHESDPAPRLVQTRVEWEAIPQESSQKRTWWPEVRQYCIWDEALAYGWVQSRPYQDLGYTAELYVRDQHRRRGFGRSLMSRVLRDDKAAGCSATVLISSAAGAKLYPSLGFREIGTLLAFCPIRS